MPDPQTSTLKSLNVKGTPTSGWAALQGGPSLQRLNAWDPRTWRCSLWQVDNAAATFIAERGARRPRQEVALSATLGSDS